MESSTFNFFIANKERLEEHIDKIKVNNEKTLVKYGFMKGKNVSITILIYGQLNESIVLYEEKIKHILNTNVNLSNLDDFIIGIELPYTLHYSPFIRIGKENEPLIHAFNITAKFIKKE